MIEPEFIDEECIPLLERDEDDSIYEDTQQDTQAEARFTDDVIQQEIDTEINALERGFNVKITS